MYEFLKGRLILIRLCLLIAAVLLLAIGIITIYAVGNPANPNISSKNSDLSNKWEKQAVFAVIGFVAFLAVNLINYRRLGQASYWLYAFVLILLVVLLLGKIANLWFVPEINNTHRWIRIHPSLPRLQPSELCKLAYIIALAWYLRYRSNYRQLKGLIGPFALTILPMILILLEPDLGTVLLMMPILFIMLFVAGAKVKHLLIIILLTIVVSPLMWWGMDKYQRIRISSILLQNQHIRQKAIEHPKFAQILLGKNSTFSASQWKNNWGFHLIRSKYAVASGGANGYGFRQGPFIKYNFLPERHNDFIFAIIAHQWGFKGCMVILALYIVIIACGLEIAVNNTDPFGRLLAVGITAMFAVEVIVNVAMTLGLMPITGLTLPLVSYGGSSLLVTMASIGLLNNIGRRRAFSVAPKSLGQEHHQW